MTGRGETRPAPPARRGLAGTVARCKLLVAGLALGVALSAGVRSEPAPGLLDALKAREYDRAAALVNDGADVNVVFPDGKTPLMVANKPHIDRVAR